MRTELRSRFEVRGEIVGYDPAIRMLTLRVMNGEGNGAGSAATIRVQVQTRTLMQRRVGSAWVLGSPAALNVGQAITARGTIHNEIGMASQIWLGEGR